MSPRVPAEGDVAPTRPSRLDVAVGLVLTVVGVATVAGSTPNPVPVLVLISTFSLALVWRRTHPLAASVVAIGATLLLTAFPIDGPVPTLPVAVALATYSLGRGVAAPLSHVVAALSLIAAWVLVLVGDAPPSDTVVWGIIIVGPYVAGAAVRQRVVQTADLERQVQQATALRNAEAEAARVSERLELARELHDVVAHALSAVAIQTQAVRRRLTQASHDEAEHLEQIEMTARAALDEMRRVIGVVRHPQDVAPTTPQPGLAQLEALIDESHRSGVSVDLAVTGDPRPLPPGVDHAAYRVVQEALTNVRRHSTSDRAHVAVAFSVRNVELTIRNAVAECSTRTTDDGSDGVGLIGMRERVALCGGDLSSGRLPDGGFEVRARLPVSAGS